jgi:hypothetical protein
MTRRMALLALVALLAGCQGVVRKDFDLAGNSSRMKVGDPAIATMVDIVRADTEVLDGYMRVRILLHNKTPLRRELEYKVVFSDSKGMPLPDTWGWRPVNLEPKGDEVIEVKSFSKDAASFQLQLQRASMEDMR